LSPAFAAIYRLTTGEILSNLLTYLNSSCFLTSKFQHITAHRVPSFFLSDIVNPTFFILNVQSVSLQGGPKSKPLPNCKSY